MDASHFLVRLYFNSAFFPLTQVYIRIYGIQRVVNRRYLSGTTQLHPSPATFPGRPSRSDRFHLRQIA